MTAATGQAPGPDERLTAHEPDADEAQLTAVPAPREPGPRELEPQHEREPEPGLAQPEPREPEPGEEPEPEPEPGEEEPERLPAIVIPNLRPYADPKAVIDLARRGAKASRRPTARLGRRALAGLAHISRLLLAGLAHISRLLLAGSRILLGLLIGWMTGAYGKGGSVLARFGGVALLLYVLARTIGLYPVEAPIAAVWTWCLAALFAARGAFDALVKKATGGQRKAAKKDEEKATKEDGKKKGQVEPTKDPTPVPAGTPAEDVDQAPAEGPVEPPLTALIRELIGDDNGVHLQALRPAMRERLPGLQNATNQELRQVLVRADWDPSRTFRSRGVPGRAGIHRDQLPPLPSPEDGAGPLSDSLSTERSAGQDDDSPLLSARGEGSGEKRRKGHKRAPEGWTEEEAARGFRSVADPAAGPHASRIERLDGPN
ncbi:hypothetical protein [Streptomyces europaeiscabiei]|uniref:hypothetical protein n=1 Tax=Streptomyces europaeiscabiei TaxID=146819 RepID=UPI002E0F0595|nr:hypothetical protein OHB30_33075 [Streptomyces europaeiscabiei]